ncbi:MAG: iron-sulfur cluster assembly protein [Gammaproteobacteria bacterium]
MNPAETMTIDSETRPVPYMVGTETSPLEPSIVEVLRTVYDPEIPVSVFELGLIYDLRISDDGVVKVIMTLTTPTCPVAEELPGWVERALYTVDGVSRVEIELVWEPFWRPEYMTEEARLQLGLW